MKSVKTVQILIDRDPMTKIGKTIFAWELPVYEEKFTVKIINEAAVDIDELPDANEEFARMQEFFGADENNQSILGLVYGRGREGAAKLDKAIKAAHRNAGKPVEVEADDDVAEAAGADDALSDPVGSKIGGKTAK